MVGLMEFTLVELIELPLHSHQEITLPERHLLPQKVQDQNVSLGLIKYRNKTLGLIGLSFKTKSNSGNLPHTAHLRPSGAALDRTDRAGLV